MFLTNEPDRNRGCDPHSSDEYIYLKESRCSYRNGGFFYFDNDPFPYIKREHLFSLGGEQPTKINRRCRILSMEVITL